jgi:glycosyltransferase involved in cell wall biosynthesis
MIDILFIAWNRMEFTCASLRALAENTNWANVRQLIVHDDGSTDGTEEFLEAELYRLNIQTNVRLMKGRTGSPTGIANLYLRQPGQEFLIKIDNDAMMPPGWLKPTMQVMQDHRELGILGLSAVNLCADIHAKRWTYTPAIVGGICAMRTSAFNCCIPWDGGRYGGAQMWQSDHSMPTNIVCTGPFRPENPPHKWAGTGWISPGLPVFLLDHVPFEPWRSLSKKYIENKWQRDCGSYSIDDNIMSWWCHADNHCALEV